MQVSNAQELINAARGGSPDADPSKSAPGSAAKLTSKPAVTPSREGLDLELDGRLVLDAQWKIIEVNARALVLLNCRMRALHGFDLWDVMSEEITDEFQDSASEALVASSHHSFVAHDKFEGTWIEFSFRREGAGFVLNLRDVASVKKLQRLLDDSERNNRMIFEANPHAMWVFDARSLRILAANQAATAFYGISPKRFLSLNMSALFPPGDDAELLNHLSSAKASRHQQSAPVLCKQLKMDGQAVLVELACSNVNWQGHTAVLVGLVDVSRRHVEDRVSKMAHAGHDHELESLKTAFANSERDLSALVFALSHELRGPLHAVNGFAAILGDKYGVVLGDVGQHYVDRIQGSSRQMAKLVHYLLTLAQLPALSAKLERVDLAPICKAIVADLRSGDLSRSVAFEMDANMVLWGDKGLLSIAMACLLENAWKFTSRKEEGWIKLGLQPGKTAGEVVMVITDNGAGFDAAYTEKLFKPFQRLHSSADFPGNGLGLAIVQRVAERHLGSVWAQTDHFGATFFMALPQSQASAGASIETSEPVPSATLVPADSLAAAPQSMPS